MAKLKIVEIPSINDPIKPSPGFAKKDLATHKLTRVGRMRRGRVVGPGEVYCGRPSSGRHPGGLHPGEYGCFGNPFRVGPYEDDVACTYPAPKALALYEDYFAERLRREPDFYAAVLALQGQLLLCWCVAGVDSTTPGELRCHAQHMARWIDSQPQWTEHLRGLR